MHGPFVKYHKSGLLFYILTLSDNLDMLCLHKSGDRMEPAKKGGERMKYDTTRTWSAIVATLFHWLKSGIAEIHITNGEFSLKVNLKKLKST